MTKTLSLALAAAIALFAVPAVAAEANDWAARTAGAYLNVYTHYCAPSFNAGDAVPTPPSMEVAIYSDIFRVDYDGDCRAFYLSEIVPRLDAIDMETVVLAKQ